MVTFDISPDFQFVVICFRGCAVEAMHSDIYCRMVFLHTRIENFMPSFFVMFRLALSPPDKKNIWPIKNTSQQCDVYLNGTVSGSGTGPLDYRATGPVPDP